MILARLSWKDWASPNDVLGVPGLEVACSEVGQRVPWLEAASAKTPPDWQWRYRILPGSAN
jgi:hypothetical protein